MSGYIVVPPSQPEQQPQAQTQGNGSGAAMIVIAVLFGFMGAVGGYHAGITRNDIALSKLKEKADTASQQYADCQAWVEAQDARVERFYSDYTQGPPSGEDDAPPIHDDPLITEPPDLEDAPIPNPAATGGEG